MWVGCAQSVEGLKKTQRLTSPKQGGILPADCLWTWIAPRPRVCSPPAYPSGFELPTPPQSCFCQWKSGCSMGSWGKPSEDPRMEDCDVAKFIWVEICPQVSNFQYLSVSSWKKCSRVFSNAKTKASVRSFWFILKLNPSEPALSAVGPS